MKTIDDKDIDIVYNLDKENTLITFGLIWKAADDLIVYIIKPGRLDCKITKRTISSGIAKIFDPLGLLKPSFFFAQKKKKIMQDTWSAKIEWDQHLNIF